MSNRWIRTQACLETFKNLRDAGYAQRRGLELDPRGILRLNQGLQNFMSELPEDEAACRTSPEIGPVQWDWLLTVSGRQLTEQVARDRQRARRPPEPQPPGVTPVVQRAVAGRRRFVDLVNSNGFAPDFVAATRRAIFGNRAPVQSRADLEAEYDLMIRAVELLESPPAEVVAYLPTLKEIRRALHETRPLKRGRPPEEPVVVWSEETILTAWLVFTLHAKVLSWVLAVAKNDRTIAAVQKLLLNRPAGERGQPSPAPEAPRAGEAETSPGAAASSEGEPPPEPEPAAAAENTTPPADDPELPPELAAELNPPGQRNGHDRRPRE